MLHQKAVLDLSFLGRGKKLIRQKSALLSKIHREIKVIICLTECPSLCVFVYSDADSFRPGPGHLNPIQHHWGGSRSTAQ